MKEFGSHLIEENAPHMYRELKWVDIIFIIAIP